MEYSTDFTKGSIYKHIRQIAIPASTGLIFTTMFNVVDTYYAGQKVGTDALAGITLSFPIFFIIISISSGLGSGTAALASIAIGNKDKEKFHQLFYNSIILGIFASIFLLIINPILIPKLLELTGAKDQSLIEGLSYINVLFYGSFFFILNSIFNGILSSQGDTKSYRNFLIFGFFLNLILDPLFIMGYFNLPQLGSMGVALSTVIIIALGSVYLASRVYKSVEFDKKIFKKQKNDFTIKRELLSQGIPSSLNTATTAIGIFVINYFIVQITNGPVTIAAYGASLRIEQLALIPTMGLNTAALTIVGQNFGAKNYDRIREVQKKIVFLGLIIICSFVVIIYPFIGNLLAIFDSDPAVIREGETYLRIGLLIEPTYVLIWILVSVLQGIKKPKFTFVIGLYRQLVMPFFLISILSHYFGIKGVWWSIFIINWSATIIAYLYNKKLLRKLGK